MKKIIIQLCLVIILMNVMSGCKKWLEVQPEDQFTEDQIFSNSQGFEDALNGIYISMGKENLYGETLTLSTLDILAQRYNITTGSSGKHSSFIAYDYWATNARPTFNSIWGNSYIAIANINHLLTNLDKFGQNIAASRAKIIKGEILGLRAFLHFDLLRMYGPVYDSPDSTKLAIPYYKELNSKVGEFEPANSVMNKILTDLKDAETILNDDPAKFDGSKNLNSYRFNYYAVKALEARVQLWRNNKEGALNAAKAVISATSIFPWVNEIDVIGSTSPDRIFSSELVFATYNKNLYVSNDNLFYYELSESDILSAKSSVFIADIYENSSNDYRNSYLWKVPPSGKDYPTFLKYSDVVDKKKTFRSAIPLIRLSEMYYIAAETEPNANTALAYLNDVRNHRGVASLINPASLSNEILKEYRKEFYGEGQLWFYYKRKKISSVMSPNNSSNTLSIPSSAWLFPIPEAELANR